MVVEHLFTRWPVLLHLLIDFDVDLVVLSIGLEVNHLLVDLEIEIIVIRKMRPYLCSSAHCVS